MVTINGEENQMAVGDEYVLPDAPAKDDSTFIGWYNGDEFLGNAGDTITITDDITITAKYEAVEISSSSSADDKSSSSKGDKDTDGIVPTASVPQFTVTAVGRSLSISGAPANAKVTVFDLRGNVIHAGFAYATSFSVNVPNKGAYLVRVDSVTRRVNMK